MKTNNDETLTLAFALALCDILTNEAAKLHAILNLLVEKGVVTGDELVAATQSIARLPPASVREISATFEAKLQERVAVRHQELLQGGTSRVQ